MDLYPEFEITHDQAEAIARGLFVIAKSDGVVHDREAALIGDFFAATTERAADLNALARGGDIEPATLAALLPSADLRRVFLKTSILLAYSDGGYGVGESQRIVGFAKAMGLELELPGLEGQVKEFMLANLSHLQNVESVAQVARELKL